MDEKVIVTLSHKIHGTQIAILEGHTLSAADVRVLEDRGWTIWIQPIHNSVTLSSTAEVRSFVNQVVYASIPGNPFGSAKLSKF